MVDRYCDQDLYLTPEMMRLDAGDLGFDLLCLKKKKGDKY